MAVARLWLKGIVGLVLVGGFVLAISIRPAVAGGSAWTVVPGPSRDPVGPFAKVRLPKMVFKGDQPHGTALSLPSHKAIVCYLDGLLSDNNKTKVLLCDVKQGTVLRESSREGAFLPFDFNAEGTRVLCRRDHMGTGKKDTTEVWTLDAGGAITARRWVPYDEDSLERDVLWAAFVGADRMATLSSGGRLVVWEAATLKPLWSVSASTAFPAVSPDRAYVAFVRDARVGLLDVTRGIVRGFVSLGSDVESAALAFRSDGQALLCAAKDKIILADTATGQTRSVTIPGISGHSLHPLPSVGWADDRLLFVNDNLIDPEVPLPIWHYMGGVWSRPAGGHVWFLVTKGMTEVGLVPVRLPHASAVKKMMAARGDSSSFLLKPGDAVQIDVRQVPRQYQDDARQALESALRATDYQPSPNAALTLEVIPGEERFEERTYTIIHFYSLGGSNGDNKDRQEKHRFRVQPVDVRLLKDGKEIWSGRTRATPAAPVSVSFKDGESLADKLAPFSASDYLLLGKLQLPKFLYEQLGRGVTRRSLGHSTVSPDGVDDSLDDRMERLDALKKGRPKRAKP